MRPVLVSTWSEPQKYFDAFMETSRRYGLQPQNADSATWAGTDWSNKEWFRKTEAQSKFVRDTRGQFDVYLFTDSFDVAFACGWDEILRKFQAYNSPIVCAAECYPWPRVEQATLYPPTPHRAKYLNAGCWIGTAEAAESLLADIEQIAAKREQCDQGILVDAFLSKRHPIVLDTACSICFCCNLDSLNYLDLTGSRPKTKDTGEEPCIFHANGGSPLTGVIACLGSPRE